MAQIETLSLFDFGNDENGNYVLLKSQPNIKDIFSGFKGKIVEIDKKIIITNKNTLYKTYNDVGDDNKVVFIKDKPIKMLCEIGFEEINNEYHIFAEEKSCEILGGCSWSVDTLERAISEIKKLLEKYNFIRV